MSKNETFDKAYDSNEKHLVPNITIIESYIISGLLLLIIFSILILRVLFNSNFQMSKLAIFDHSTTTLDNLIMITSLRKTDRNNSNSAIERGLMIGPSHLQSEK